MKEEKTQVPHPGLSPPNRPTRLGSGTFVNPYREVVISDPNQQNLFSRKQETLRKILLL